MPVYTWTGRTRQGGTKKGVMEAVNEAAVIAQLRSQGVVPGKVSEKPKDIQEIMMDARREATQYSVEHGKAIDKTVMKKAKNLGLTVHVNTEEQDALWSERLRFIREEWAAEQGEKGQKYLEVLERLKAG